MCVCVPECIHLFKRDDESLSNLQMEALLHSEDTSIMSPCRYMQVIGMCSAHLYQPLALPITPPELTVISNFMVCEQARVTNYV